MAKNDAILMDGIIDDRVEQCIPSNKRDECFEFLALEQILKDEDLSFDEINTIKANIMVQIAINQALEINAPKFKREKFNDAIEYALTLTMEHEKFYPKIYAKFREAGVILVILPNSR